MEKEEKLRKVFQALNELTEEDKQYFMGYFAIEPNLDKFNKKIKAFVEAT